MAFLTIIIVLDSDLVRPLQENFLDIFESGNICLHRRVKWSAIANGKLCSSTKFVNRVSLQITSSVSAFTVKKVCNSSCGVLQFLQPGVFVSL